MQGLKTPVLEMLLVRQRGFLLLALAVGVREHAFSRCAFSLAYSYDHNIDAFRFVLVALLLCLNNRTQRVERVHSKEVPLIDG